MCIPREPDVLTKVGILSLSNSPRKSKRNFTNPFEVSSFHRIQVEMQVVRPVHLITTRVPGIQVNATEIHQPQ